MTHSASAAAVPGSRPAGESIESRASFEFIRYGNVWEDADVLCEALAPVAANRPLLSVASAGDNALALLTLDPGEVVAVDLSRAQLACLALRIAAMRQLDHRDLLAFMGVSPASDRVATYRRLRGDIPIDAREFWDRFEAVIAQGIIRTGRFESYFATFRRWVLPLAISRRNIRRLLAARDLPEQRAAYDAMDTWRWRALFGVFFSRAVMGRLGRDPEFFREVDGPVSARILKRTRHALTEIHTASNPYFTAIMTGAFTTAALPRYLRAEHHETIAGRLDRLRLSLGGVEEAGGGPFAGANLSDVFEYMDPAEHERVYGALLDRLIAGGRLVYWNLLADRGRPARYADRARPLADVAGQLHPGDRAWFYDRVHVDEVLGASS